MVCPGFLGDTKVYTSGSIFCAGNESNSEELLRHNLEGNDPVNTVSPENAELTFVVTAEIDTAATPLTGAGERHLVNGPDAKAVFVFEQHHRLARHRHGQAKSGKFNQFEIGRAHV